MCTALIAIQQQFAVFTVLNGCVTTTVRVRSYY
jgi:hypothetical protein